MDTAFRARGSSSMFFLFCVALFGVFPGACNPYAPGVCGGGTWQVGTLEIHHLALGQADATLVVAPSGRTLLIDLGEEVPFGSGAAQRAAVYLERTIGCRHLDYALLTHFHLDHVGQPGTGGLWHLVEVEGFSVGRTLHRDGQGFAGEAGRIQQLWQAYLEGGGAARLRPRIAVRGADQIDLGPEISVRIVAVDGDGVRHQGLPRAVGIPNENDFSIALVLRFGLLDYFAGGDLSGELAPAGPGSSYHDLETSVARALPDLDIYRVSHHGSDHSSNPTFLAQTDPEVSIVSVGNNNRHGHPHRPALERIASTGAVFLTERGAAGAELHAARVAGDVVVRSRDGRTYTVAGEAFRATDPVRVDADRDGYFVEADPDDGDPRRTPAPRGGCDPVQQRCPADW